MVATLDLEGKVVQEATVVLERQLSLLVLRLELKMLVLERQLSGLCLDDATI